MKHDKFNLALEGDGIDRDRYRELYYFCKQYRQFKKRLNAICSGYVPSGIGAQENSGLPAMLHADVLRNKIDQIEQACHQAGDPMGIYPALLANVTEDVRYEDMDIPCGRRQFYEARRNFYRLLGSGH